MAFDDNAVTIVEEVIRRKSGICRFDSSPGGIGS
jgi:hypothetical protein